MATAAEQIQQETSERREAFLSSLPPEVRLNTDLSDGLKRHLLENSPKQVAYSMARCIEARAWEAVALNLATRHQKVVSFTPVQWMQEYLNHSPDEIMRIIAGYQPDPQIAANAAVELIAVVREDSEAAFRSLLTDKPDDGSGHILPGWTTLLNEKARVENGPWTVAAASLDRAVKQPRGKGTATKVKSVAGNALTTKVQSQSTTAVRRRLEAALENPQLTAPAKAKVQAAYDLFLTGPKHYKSLDHVKAMSGLYGEVVREARSQVSTTTTAERLGQWLLEHWPKDRLQALTRYLMEHSE